MHAPGTHKFHSSLRDWGARGNAWHTPNRELLWVGLNHVAGGDLPPTLAGTPCYVAPVEGKGVDDIGKINQLSLAILKLGCPGAVPWTSLWCPLAAPWIPWRSKLMTRRSVEENDRPNSLSKSHKTTCKAWARRLPASAPLLGLAWRGRRKRLLLQGTMVLGARVLRLASVTNN